MDLSLSVPHIARAPSPKRAQSAPAHQRSRFSATKRVDPALWDKEVVHALCTRLPGGISSVTKPCSICKSVFYPCLCEPPGRDYGLRAPRIIRAAEECRLSVCSYPPRLIGSLYSVHSRAERVDMNKNRLVVMGNEGMGFVRRSLKTAQVLDREAANYLVKRDGGMDVQRLSFTWEELEALERCLEDREDKCIVADCVESKLVTISYTYKAQADQDVVLGRVPLGWEVRQVKERGIAAAAGLSEGHALAHVKVKDRWQDTWSEQRPPCSFWPADDPATAEEPDDARAFPCELTFERLPAGSCAVREVDADGVERRFRRKRLEELIAAKEGATIVFERSLQEFVSRDAVLCRHEHLWEKRPEDFTPEEDESLLRHWTFGSHLTLAGLSFIFKKLVDMVTDEMQHFERAKGLRMRLLLEKCRHAVELREEGQQPGGPADPLALDGELRCVLGEVQAIFRAVPAYFLREIIGETLEQPKIARSQSKAFKRPSFVRRGSTATELANALATSEVEQAEPDVFDFLAGEVKKYLASLGPEGSGSMGATVSAPSSPKKEATGSVLERGATLERRSDPALHRIRRAAAKTKSEPKTLMEESELDGKISHKEFERILIKAGVTWLTRAQQKQMFDSLDQDGTGKLNLGEILSAAGRIMELISRAASYAEERRKEHRNVPQAKLLQEFCRDCLRGNVLCKASAEATVFEAASLGLAA